MQREERGLPGQVLVYYGEGKGKTTAAFGLALRAVGRGWRVCMVQFTKSGEWPPGHPVAENIAAARLAPELEVITTGLGFVNIFGDPYTFEEHRAAAQAGLHLARDKMLSQQYQLVILDEAIGAVSQGQLDLEDLLGVIRERPRQVNVLLTGHDDKGQFIHRLIEEADLVTEMRKVKHPFDKGHQARKGLDY